MKITNKRKALIIYFPTIKKEILFIYYFNDRAEDVAYYAPRSRHINGINALVKHKKPRQWDNSVFHESFGITKQQFISNFYK